MNRRHNSKTSLFLMELIIAIMFFSLASAVCVRLFSGAHTLSERSININNAVTWSQNLAEAFYGSKADPEELSKLYPDAFISAPESEEDSGSLMLFFDENWELNESGPVDARYEALLETKREKASEVYADVNEYAVNIEGDAMVGNIVVIDLFDTTEAFSTFPEDKSRIIYAGRVDFYIGKEGR